MNKHKVIFMSPGTFASETTTVDIDSWDVEKAKEMARTVKERYGATPFGFMFETWTPDKIRIDVSPTYYLGGRVRTYEMVLLMNLPEEEILRSNMRYNDIKRVITNTNSYKSVLPLNDDDIVLEDWEP
jgi:hypothetical protein